MCLLVSSLFLLVLVDPNWSEITPVVLLGDTGVRAVNNSEPWWFCRTKAQCHFLLSRLSCCVGFLCAQEAGLCVSGPGVSKHQVGQEVHPLLPPAQTQLETGQLTHRAGAGASTQQEPVSHPALTVIVKTGRSSSSSSSGPVESLG